MEKSPYEIEIIQKKASYHSDPTKIFNHLCGSRSSTLLLETAEVNKKNDLESIMIIDSALRVSAIKNSVKITALSDNGMKILSALKKNFHEKIKIFEKNKSVNLIFPPIEKNIDEDEKIFSLSVFDSFRFIMKIFKNTKKISKAMFFGGLFSYDLISNFEFLPNVKKKQKCPDFCFYLAETLLVLDHQKKTCLIQSSLFSKNLNEKKRIIERTKEIQKKLKEKLDSIPKNKVNLKTVLTSNMSDFEYSSIIKKLQKLIQKGEIFQVVPSRKFFLPCNNSLAAYQELKKNNPSPYMFFMQDENFILFGASPESSLKYDENTRQIELYPIAGTRPRGRKRDGTLDLDLDSRIELEMRTNHKELAEHLMLVDLARNDLARICEPGSRYVSDLVKVDKYSHVMHLVSKVVGKLKKGLDALHAYSSCMNMGTLTGAPKVRAMQLIAECEKEGRGSYGGAIGYFTDLGNLDTCITIRSAYVEKDIATIQAGAGVVFNSIPQDEVKESLNKAKAVINAIKKAHFITGSL
ncbi:anthranilate synthase large subunit (plasmid) [Buchnera aphidicola str. Ak (Acyrthosiphon kondoi)]|uniref:Anthranilate synthase component 1 n=1 Tax=Buchnera aphidicola str. Ak (Acyrthosiphon kondoi) TaxID=1005090 RepID=G2LNN2_9GAMM|nr:anthranilate synthase component 1 [Buchnera aphidicola]AEO08940.1 anthranilate synthase large subunit [Buchnera aphidicola str. Ak (Acyrthosiphon kondoi)]